MINAHYMAINGTLNDAFRHFIRRDHSKHETVKLSYKWLADVINNFGIQLDLSDEFFDRISEMLVFVVFLRVLPSPKGITVAAIIETPQFQVHTRQQLKLLLSS